MRNKIAVLVMSVIMLCSAMSTTVYAEYEYGYIDEEIIEEYVNADSVSNSLNVVSNTAYCDSYCSGYSNVVQISATQTLQKFWGLWIWNDVSGASWHGSSNSNEIDLSNSKDGLSNGTYRLKSVFTLTTSNGKTETITIYSTEKTVD